MRAAHATTASAVALVLAATLFPVYDAHPEASPWCLTCDDTWLADFLGNVVLFLPLGVGLALAGRSLRTVLLVGVSLSLGVELLQVVVPGRTSAVRDLLSNASGALLGAYLLRAAPVLATLTPRHRPVAGTAALVAALTAVLGAGGLSAPTPPPGVLVVDWRPDRPGRPGPYRAPLLEASVDGLPLPDGDTLPRSAFADLRAGTRRVFLRVRWAGPSDGRRSLLAFVDPEDREHEAYEIDGVDLVHVVRSRGSAIGLRAREVRLEGAAAPGPHADALRVSYTQRSGRVCASTGGRTFCAAAAPVGRGWTLIQGEDLLPRGWAFLGDAMWLAALFFPAGVWLRGRLLPAAAATAPALVLLPPLTGMVAAGPWEIAAALLGLTLGGFAQPLLARVVSRNAPSESSGPPLAWRRVARSWRQRAIRR